MNNDCSSYDCITAIIIMSAHFSFFNEEITNSSSTYFLFIFCLYLILDKHLIETIDVNEHFDEYFVEINT